MPSRFPLRLLLVAGLCLAGRLSAARTEWPDENGKKFKGEPADVLGPFAVFRASGSNGKTVPWHILSVEECTRFNRELAAARPIEPAASAAMATRGSVFRELQGRTLSLVNGKFQPADLAARAEPQVIVLVSLSSKDGAGARMVNAFHVNYRRIQQVYPGQMEAVFLGQNQSPESQLALAKSRHMPWLVADPKQQARLTTLTHLVPYDASVIFALTRNGIPLMSASGHDEEGMRAFMDALGRVMRTIHPDNPRTWGDRLHYLNAVRPLEFAAGRSDPVLLGNPLPPDALRNYGVSLVSARISVGADGKVTGVAVSPEAGVPPAVSPGVTTALQRGLVFSPAIDRGVAVAGEYAFTFVVPPPDPERAATAAWLNVDPARELPIKSWLVLKTFKVPQQGFLEIDHVDENGVSIMKAVKALHGRKDEADLKSQKSAFADDWFTPEELVALAPTPGLKQKIDNVDYTWRPMKPDGHAVELQTLGRSEEQYCYAYAWTEIEVPQDQPALLGLGSDDGVKVWLNGEVLVEKWVQRPLQIDEDVLPLRLKKGKNRLLLKVQNIWGEWSFSARLMLLPIPTARNSGGGAVREKSEAPAPATASNAAAAPAAAAPEGAAAR